MPASKSSPKPGRISDPLYEPRLWPLPPDPEQARRNRRATLIMLAVTAAAAVALWLLRGRT